MDDVVIFNSISKLQILKNKPILILTGSPPRTNNETLYKQNCMLNLNKINTYLVGKFMYDVYHCIVPQVMFAYINMIHYHDTRTSGLSHRPTTSSNSSRNSIRYHGVISWNHFLTVASKVILKIMLKKRNLTGGYNSWLLNSEYCYCN